MRGEAKPDIAETVFSLNAILNGSENVRVGVSFGRCVKGNIEA